MDRLDIIVKQLVEDKTEDVIELFKTLSEFDMCCLNKFYNMDFKLVRSYSDKDLWFECCRRGYVKIVQQLINEGININLQNYNNNTALMLASTNGYTNVVELLLQQKDIDVNMQNINGNTALIRSAMWHEVETVKLLLQHKDIDINIKNKRYKRAFDYDNDEIKQLLINHEQ